MEGILALERRRERLAAAHSALQGLGAELWRAGGDDLGPLLGELDALAGACDAGRVAVISETGPGPVWDARDRTSRAPGLSRAVRA